MKKILYTLSVMVLVLGMTACGKDTKSYADLVSSEEAVIDHLITVENIQYTEINEETVKEWTKAVLNDSINPASFIKLGHWYSITEGDFKRLYFKINNWGAGHDRYLAWQSYKDSIQNNLHPQVRPDSVSFYNQKIVNGSYVTLRYDSLYLMTDTLNIHSEIPADNLDPYSYQLIYGWNESYYASTYYSYYYGSSSTYACTSGGLAFPVRFLWYDSEVSLIVPFSLVSTEYSSYYYTFYYGKVKYSKPNYLPE